MTKLGKDCRVDAQFHGLEQHFSVRWRARICGDFHHTPSLISLRIMLDG